jgi:hypothetical protein
LISSYTISITPAKNTHVCAERAKLKIMMCREGLINNISSPKTMDGKTGNYHNMNALNLEKWVTKLD